MSDYPQYPTDPNNPSGGPAYAPTGAGRGPRPASVDIAVKLIWATIALSLVSAVVTFVMLDSIIDQQLEAAGVSETISSDSVRSITVATLLAIFIGKGANWARIVYTVLAALGVLGSLFGFGSEPIALGVLSLLSLLLTVVAVVMLFRAESNAWFKAR